MEQLLRGGKFLTRFIARDQRSELIEVERELNRLADIVDRFYKQLGPRNWIFHDDLSVDSIESILDFFDTGEL